MYIQLEHPFSMLVAGPSGSGKTTFIQQLLNNIEIIDIKIHKIIWCNTDERAIPAYLQRQNVEVLHEIPDEFLNEHNKPLLLILDDMMNDDKANKKACQLFTRDSHHRNISVIFITQNLFHKGTYCRDISLNAKYIVLLKNPRDKAQFNHLARQIYPENAKELQKIYKEITHHGYRHFFIDLSQRINDLLRFRANIFNKSYCTIYCNLNQLKHETTKKEQTYVICAKSSNT